MSNPTVHRDPVCGMPVNEMSGVSVSTPANTFWFCSELCKRQFEDHPESYGDSSTINLSSGRRPDHRIAYFSMEIALESHIPTYAGGLGVLAGDTLRACADASVPIVGVTLVHRKGYFKQQLDMWGNQSEQSDVWSPDQSAVDLDPGVTVTINGRDVHVRAWRYSLSGQSGWIVPVLLLDTDLPQNHEEDRRITDRLYGGDERNRLAQEIVLGIGGVRMLRATGFTNVSRYQMNEGHSSMLVTELLRETKDIAGDKWDFDLVRRQCVFTTHTPVPAGHDHFSWDLVEKMLESHVDLDLLRMLGGEDQLNMTLLGLNASHYVNGVAKRHAEVSRQMFPNYTIDSVTNGVHAATWASDSFRDLYDRHIPGWRVEPSALRYGLSIPKSEIWDAHEQAKQSLLDHVNQRFKVNMQAEILTIGFARRATPYKRSMLLFHNLDRLRSIARRIGGLQVILAGKAHPYDAEGKELIGRISEAGRRLVPDVKVVYLPNYDMDMARLIIGGCDLWLNTPCKPLEASGTSGMKAAVNGVPQFSVLDGWWLEGHIEGVTGWCIGTRDAEPSEDVAEGREMYEKLESIIGPMFYSSRNQWIEVMRHAMAVNGSFFNARRMVQEYALNAYLR